MSESSPRSRGFCNERNHVFTMNPCSIIHEKQDLVLTAAILIIRSPLQVNSLIGLVIGRCHPGRMNGYLNQMVLKQMSR